MSSALAMLAATGTNAPTYIDDIFATTLYTGNGSTQTITNGIDLAGKGGLVWIKQRTAGTGPDHAIFDTARGIGKILCTNNTLSQTTISTVYELNSFNSNGFTLGSDGGYGTNQNNIPIASWTFRKAAKFFDVVTYTGNGAAGRAISHSFGTAPGMVIIKRTDSTSNWLVYHRSLTANYCARLNTTDAAGNYAYVYDVTSTTFSVYSDGTQDSTNTNAGTYVAYLFAHDTTTDGLIQCGSFTTDGSGNATVTLGWEPQFVLVKRSDNSAGGDWMISDSMRGITANSSKSPALMPNLSSAEDTTADRVKFPTATGFSSTTPYASATYIYLAIRRPNKPPTTGTQVFATDIGNNSGSATSPEFVSGFPVDASIIHYKTGGSFYEPSMQSRLTGSGRMVTYNASAESADGSMVWSFQNGYFNSTFSSAYLSWMFRRAPGVFDVVCYTGTGAARTVNHSLGVAPELMIVKGRTGGISNWYVYAGDATKNLFLNATNANTTSSAPWNNTAPTSSAFTAGSANSDAAYTYVAYLFATKTGISYVGSYTGNGGTAGSSGSSQNLDFGFSAGARFVMIKATNATGDWFVWDSTRGIVASTDPHLSLNTTAAEVTTDDSVDPLNAGITVNQLAATDLNVTGRTYLVLSFA